MEPLSALFMMMVSPSISCFRACHCLYVRLSFGFNGVCNVLCISSFMSSSMFIISMFMLWWDVLFLVEIICLGVSGGIAVGVCGWLLCVVYR